jgi:protein SCO1/2
MKALLLGITIFGSTAFALTTQDLQRVTFDQHVGQSIPGKAAFRTSAGASVTMQDLVDGRRPILLVLGYFRCPMLCTLVNDGLIKALQDIRPSAGPDFTIIDLSIDPHETPASAAMRKTEYLKQYGRAGAAEGWHFLVGEKPAIEAVTDAAGFHYAYDNVSGEYAHPSGLIVLTPQGEISSYLLGVNFDAAELLRALQTAGRGESGSIVHQLALLCFHYNPLTGKYSLAILKTLRVAGVITLLGGGLMIGRLVRRAPGRARI